MKLLKRSLLLVFLPFFMVTMMFSGCDNGSTSSEDPETEIEVPEDEETVIPPPENLMGTISLGNGTSAVMDIQFDDIASGARASTVGVSGKIRYEGFDYIVGGLYDYSTGALDLFAKKSTGEKFVFSGTYNESTGFQGTIILYDASGVEDTSGSVSAVPVSDASKASIKICQGTFSGDAAGVWNGTLTADRFYGSYCIYGDNEGATFTMIRSGNTLTMNASAYNPQGSGTVDGDTIYGEWGDENENGYWTGAAVSSTTYDPPSMSTLSSNPAYMSNLIFQALSNSSNIAKGNNDDGVAQPTGLTYSETLGPPNVVTVTMNAYTDPRTLLGLTGTMIFTRDAAGTSVLLQIDDNGDVTGDTTGLAISGISETCYVNAKLIYASGSFEAGAVWTYGGTDVLAQVIQFF
jgi:hypothetical protein